MRIVQNARSRSGRVFGLGIMLFMISSVIPPCGVLQASGGDEEGLQTHRRGDIQSSLKRRGQGDLRVEVEGLIGHPVQEIRTVLLDIAGFGRWFPSIADWQILEGAPSGILVHGRQDFPWPLQDRDYVVLYTWKDDTEGLFTLVAIAQPNALPKPGRGVVRVERMRTAWMLKESEGGSSLRYVWEGDPGLALPSGLAQYGWQSHTNSVIEQLSREVERRQFMSSD